MSDRGTGAGSSRRSTRGTESGTARRPEVSRRPTTRQPGARRRRDPGTKPPTSTKKSEKEESDEKQKGSSKEIKKPEDVPGPPIHMTDIIFITVVWSSEAGKIAMLLFLRHSTIAMFGKKAKWTLMIGALVMMALAFFMIAVFLRFKFSHQLRRWKYWIIFGGLTVYYFVDSVLGLLLSTLWSKAVAITMFVLTAIWYSVHPLRFMMIFHQHFPMRTTHSYFLTSFNMFVLWLVEYLLYVYISSDMYDGSSVSQWIFAIILAAVCMGGLFAVKRWKNKTPAEVKPTRAVYAPTRALLQFDRRQKKYCIFSVWFVMSLWPIFPVLRAAIRFGFDQMRSNQEIHPAFYRFDLIATIIATGFLVLFYKALGGYQSELVDLSHISLAFLASIALLVFLLVRLQNIQLAEAEAANATSTNIIEIYERDDWKDEKGYCKLILMFTIYNEAEHYMYYIDKMSYGNHFLRRNKVLVRLPLSSSKTVNVRVFSVTNGELLKETKLEVKPNTKMMYVERLGVWTADTKIQHVDNGETRPQLILVNFLKLCKHSDYIAEALDAKDYPGGIENTIPYLMESPACKFCGPLYFPNELRLTAKGEPDRTVHWVFNYSSPGPIILFPDEDYSWYEVLMILQGGKYYTDVAKIPGKIPEKWKYVTNWQVALHGMQPESSRVSILTVDGKQMRPQRFFGNSKTQMCFERIFRTVKVYNVTVKEEIIYPDKFLPDQSVLGFIISLVFIGYIHLMWIAGPIKWRVPIIYTFFGLEMIGEWLTTILLTDFTPTVVYALIAVTILCFILHSIGFASFYFYVYQKKTPEEKKDPKKLF